MNFKITGCANTSENDAPIFQWMTYKTSRSMVHSRTESPWLVKSHRAKADEEGIFSQYSKSTHSSSPRVPLPHILTKNVFIDAYPHISESILNHGKFHFMRLIVHQNAVQQNVVFPEPKKTSQDCYGEHKRSARHILFVWFVSSDKER